MKYKVGDKVRIKSLDWYNENKDKDGIVELSTHVFIPEMLECCGQIVTIKDVFEDIDGNVMYYMKEIDWDVTDEMIEGLVEEEDLIPKFGEYSDNEPLDVPTMTTEFVKEHGLPCPEGYQFKDENGNIINATKIVLEKKKKSMIREEQIDNAAQEYIDSDNAVLTYSDGFCEQTDHPFVWAAFKAGAEWADNDVTRDDCSKAPKLTSQDYSNGRFGYRLPAGFKAKLTERELILTPEKKEYPKTYEECCKVLGVDPDNYLTIRNVHCYDGEEETLKYERDLLNKFGSLWELLVCRDAYWKIAGEEMGLGKPWEPEDLRYVYSFFRWDGDITMSNTCYGNNHIFEFPTEEMRDAFYENFKELIENCKELL